MLPNPRRARNIEVPRPTLGNEHEDNLDCFRCWEIKSLGVSEEIKKSSKYQLADGLTGKAAFQAA